MLVQYWVNFAMGLNSKVTGQCRNGMLVFRQYFDLFKRPIA